MIELTSKTLLKPPLFPALEHLSIAHKSFFNEFTKKFPPYSDFNFTSLWCYDTDESSRVSIHQENLIIELPDYIDPKKKVVTLLGNSNVKSSLLEIYRTKDYFNGKFFSLIPEDSVNAIKNDVFSKNLIITEDPDNFDYVLDLSTLAHLIGNKMRGKKNLSNRFKAKYHSLVRTKYGSGKIEDKNGVANLCNAWMLNTTQEKMSVQNEYQAITRLVDSSHLLDTQHVLLYHANKPIAFCIYEVLWSNYAILHFEKADTSYEGVYQHLKQQVALDLLSKKCKYINVEQDLGIEGLRHNKKSWRPCQYLKKFRVEITKSI